MVQVCNSTPIMNQVPKVRGMGVLLTYPVKTTPATLLWMKATLCYGHSDCDEVRKKTEATSRTIYLFSNEPSVT